MLAVHFGAGNIGRGFIAQLLYNSNYEICFVDVNEEIINELNIRKSYNIVMANSLQDKLEVKNVRGINSIKDEELVINEIVKADLITTAVGPAILKHISQLIAKGLEKRLKYTDNCLNIIACENMIGASKYLKEELFKYLNQETAEKIEDTVGFPNSAVDRIVPVQSHEDILLVTPEPFFEWVIESSSIKGHIEDIKGAIYVNNLMPYIERKLFTVNTGHTAVAYIGNYYGYKKINEAMEDNRVKKFLHNILNETGNFLMSKYGFEREAHKKYIDKIIKRFENIYISDDIARVARSPIRKLGPNDRFIKPARELIKLGTTPKYLSLAIASAVIYKNDSDEESLELSKYCKEHSLKKLIIKYCGLSDCQELIELIIFSYNKLHNSKC